MKKWIAVFPDPSQVGVNKEELVEEWEHDAGALGRFENADKTREIKGRKVIGMWILDDTSEQEEVIDARGHVPPEITVRLFTARG